MKRCDDYMMVGVHAFVAFEVNNWLLEHGGGSAAGGGGVLSAELSYFSF